MIRREARTSGGFAAAAVVAIVAMLAPGCDDQGKSSGTRPPPATAPSATTRPATGPSATDRTVAPDPRAKPGYALGRVLDETGKPITVAGARAQVTIVGISNVTNRGVEYHALADAEGNYEVKVDDGSYRAVRGRVEFPFESFGEVRHYRLPLEASGRPIASQRVSRGIVQDFVWKLSGPRPGHTPDPKRPGTWYGASVNMWFQGFREDVRRSVSLPPQGTKAIFTLTPKGLMANGRPGKPLTYECQYTVDGVDPPCLHDVPLAIYEVSGYEVLPGTPPDAPRRPLLFREPSGKWAEAISGAFTGDLEQEAMQPVNVTFTRPADVTR